MIKVKYTDKMITITGHANFADFGKDIVCASISSIIITSVNNMMTIDNQSIDYTDNNNKLIIRIVKENELLIKLFNNLINLLKNLAEDYPNNIKIESEE
ncbi:MAG: ribosomal-processing cysteine protease Prp [Bacilli bacterium]|nr:ribosomal-processing cysteine protease Prp [Bacilli bacterium]